MNIDTWTRRGFVTAAGAAALAAVVPQAQAAAPLAKWKTAMGLNGFLSSAGKYKKSYPIWEILGSVARMGFEGVELVQLWPSPGDYYASTETAKIRSWRRMYDAYGLQIFSIQLSTPDAFSPEEAVRRQWLSTFADRIKLAKTLGCACVGMWPGGGLRGQRIDQAIRHLGESYARAATIAAEAGIIAAFEIEPPFVFHSEEHIHGIFEAAGNSPLTMIYDPSHFDLMNGSSGRPHELLARVGVKRIGYVQLTDTDGTLRDGGTSKHVACGDGHAQVPVSLKMLKDGGFDGWIMIDAWEIPDPYDAAEKGKRMIEAAR